MSLHDSEFLGSTTDNVAKGDTGATFPQSSVAPESRESVGEEVSLVVGDFGHGIFPITITEVVTKDFFETVTNVIYNSIPVTLTDFVKTTLTSPVTSVSVNVWEFIVHLFMMT